LIPPLPLFGNRLVQNVFALQQILFSPSRKAYVAPMYGRVKAHGEFVMVARLLKLTAALAALMLTASPVWSATDARINQPAVAAEASKDVPALRRAAEAGDAKAQLRLADDYYLGNGVEQDFEKAFEWYNRAAASGSIEAMAEVGVMYAKGLGTEKNFDKAREWSLRAADLGSVEAMYNIGAAYDNGLGVPQDLAKAFEWYKKAAEAGYDVAQFNIGNMYETGEGAPQDYAQAVYWYEKASAQDNPPARFNLGRMYVQGQGVTKDVPKGRALIETAARQGLALAQLNMAAFAYRGEGQPVDKVAAYAWALLAADGGDPDARDLVHTMDADKELSEAQVKQASDLADKLSQPV
jgi:uncharacterized protein